MITGDYKAQLTQLHGPGTRWGTTGARNFGAYIVRFLEQRRGQINTVLDFGAGKCTMEKYVLETVIDCPKVKWTNYDPGIVGRGVLNELPDRQFDLIISSDVMEHIEPELLDETIAWQKAHADKALFHHIACDPANNILPDGRNAHLITENLDWWLPKFEDKNWDHMYSAQCTVRKRSKLQNHCHIQVDKV